MLVLSSLPTLEFLALQVLNTFLQINLTSLCVQITCSTNLTKLCRSTHQLDQLTCTDKLERLTNLTKNQQPDSKYCLAHPSMKDLTYIPQSKFTNAIAPHTITISQQGNRITVLAAGVFQAVPHLRTLQVRRQEVENPTLLKLCLTAGWQPIER